ncbi:MAG TPA: LLM class F420-dependent oxidoreductase [Ilumatobacteraceae bacterium]|nr:LLM class F420-dependent oxidoreductase [Ilumatobacteraceae bacterium]
MTRLGYQIPNFTYPGVGSAELFGVVAAQAREAEQSGFDTVLVMDHFFQLPMIGPVDNYMLECYTLLAGLAGVTDRVRLSALVTGNTYRNPAVLAKTVTTLDIVSGGRGQLGIGAGWFQAEHDAFGIEFGTFTDRFEKLEEALQIIIPMLRDGVATFHGDRYSVTKAVNSPPPVGRIPVMIGGGGERKTLRMAAQYADEANVICERPMLPRKLDALAEHCARLGRDRAEITVSYQRNVCIAETTARARRDLDDYATRFGDAAGLSAEARAGIISRVLCGDPDTVAETLAGDLAAGVDGFTINMVANGHIPGRVTLLGKTVSPLIR